MAQAVTGFQSPTRDRAIEECADRTALEQELVQLSDEDLILFLVSRLTDVTLKEMGEYWGLHPSTIEKRLHRIKERLRKRLLN